MKNPMIIIWIILVGTLAYEYYTTFSATLTKVNTTIEEIFQGNLR